MIGFEFGSKILSRAKSPVFSMVLEMNGVPNRISTWVSRRHAKSALTHSNHWQYFLEGAHIPRRSQKQINAKTGTRGQCSVSNLGRLLYRQFRPSRAETRSFYEKVSRHFISTNFKNQYDCDLRLEVVHGSL